MPSKAVKKTNYFKDYRAANKEKLNAYSKSYSKQHKRKEYYEEYYACDRDLSQKRSAATSIDLHTTRILKKTELTLLLIPKQAITEILKKVKLTQLLTYDKYLETSRLAKREWLFL